MQNLYRNAIDALDWGSGEVFVVGHKSPDCDSVMSALAYAKLMQSLGHNAVARIAGKVNNETRFVSNYFGIELPEILGSVSSCSVSAKTCEPARLILMDHSDYVQAVDGAKDSRILQVLDHHGIGDIAESNLLYAKYMPVGSTCSIVYISYLELGVEVSLDVAKILFAGILSDSLNLKKVTVTDVDRTVYESLLGVLAGSWGVALEDARKKVCELFDGMVDAAHDYSAMTNEEIFNSDAKDYVIGSARFRLGSLDCRDASSIDDFANRLLAAMPNVARDSGCNMVFCRVGFEEKTYMLYSGADNTSARFAKAIAERAFGKSLREGVVYCERRLSRKLDVVPMLAKALQ